MSEKTRLMKRVNLFPSLRRVVILQTPPLFLSREIGVGKSL